MAVDIEETIRLLESALSKAMATGSDPAEIAAMTKAIDSFRAKLRESGDRMAKFAEEIKKDTTTLTDRIKNSKALQKELSDEIKHIRATSVGAQELQERLEAVNERFKDLDLDGKERLRSQIAWTNRTAAVSSMFNKSLEALSPAMSQVSKAGKAILSDYQSDSKGIGGSAAVLEAGLNIAGSTAQMAGKGMSGVGTAMMAIPGPAMAVGAVLTVVGTGLTMFGGVAKEVAEKVLPFLKTELENNIRSFQSLTSSGALFGNGISGMIKTAGDAGLTLVQFDRVVKGNSDSLAQSGLGITEASKRMGAALKAGGEPMKREMLNLGFSFEEQAGLVADTMARMRQTGGPLQASNAEVAEQTKKYAENLRMISSITGEDAKAKYKAAQESANDLAFQQKLAGMDEKQRANIVDSMANMDAATKKAVMETVIFGRAVTTESAGLMSQIPAFATRVNESAASIADGTANARKQQDINAATQADIAKQAQGQTGLAQAGFLGLSGAAGDLGKALGALNIANSRQTKEAVEAARKELDEQKITQDKQTVAANKVLEVQQKMALEIQKNILDSGVMEIYADTVQEATNAMLDMIKKFTGGRDKTGAEQARDEAQAAARKQTTFIPGLNDSDIKPEDIKAQIDLRKQELEARSKMPPTRKGTLGNTNENRIKRLNEQIEALTRAQDEADAKKKEEGTPATSTPPSTAPAPVIPVAPTTPPVNKPFDASKVIDPLDPKGGNYIPGPKTLNMTTGQWEPYKLQAQPAYKPATITPPVGAIATPVNPLSSATPTPDSVLGNNGAAPAAQQKTAAGGSIGDDKIITAAKSTEDKNNEQLTAMRKQISLQEDTIELLREINRHSRTTAEAA